MFCDVMYALHDKVCHEGTREDSLFFAMDPLYLVDTLFYRTRTQRASDEKWKRFSLHLQTLSQTSCLVYCIAHEGRIRIVWVKLAPDRYDMTSFSEWETNDRIGWESITEWETDEFLFNVILRSAHKAIEAAVECECAIVQAEEERQA
jgi:hypothetical protein